MRKNIERRFQLVEERLKQLECKHPNRIFYQIEHSGFYAIERCPDCEKAFRGFRNQKSYDDAKREYDIQYWTEQKQKADEELKRLTK